MNANVNDWMEKIDNLNLGIFEAIPSQTSEGCKRSLLAVQRVTARRHKEYAYLEIGSHLGGTIQPHLLDNRCRRIYSIDPRPSRQPDDREPGYVAYYENNTSERMIAMLSRVAPGEVPKIECIESDASRTDPGRIQNRPRIAFIDGEHTNAAVLSDFRFCGKVLSEGGTILFHDFNIIYPAIQKVLGILDRERRSYLALKLEGLVFAVFFDPGLVSADPYLASLYRENKNFWSRFIFKQRVKRYLPGPLLKLAGLPRKVFGKKTAEQ
ncbi:MAG: class I SAM-dependent methyltransferase [Candidatus Krumholzibacteriota bacterium]|nr:class I SAM-dependent methyltransferase [Candidatus Krumholzibacteriota bacterium]